MTSRANLSRRAFVRQWLLSATLAPFAVAQLTDAQAAETPLLNPADPAAKKLKYAENAAQVKEAAGNKCATCSLYQGSSSSTQGPCQLFPGKAVKAAGWCSSWAPQM